MSSRKITTISSASKITEYGSGNVFVNWATMILARLLVMPSKKITTIR